MEEMELPDWYVGSSESAAKFNRAYLDRWHGLASGVGSRDDTGVAWSGIRWARGGVLDGSWSSAFCAIAVIWVRMRVLVLSY